ncbi:hypothetical protein [Flavobacterium covae]|uniref:hypothetical protein n=1 Tax=Flavobacterium covae TaxID=2906076 RepID=UPI003396CB12
MRALYTLILLSYFYQLSYSQACGGGKFVFEFYRKDNYELKYEITSVEIKDINLASEDIYMGIVMDSIKLKQINQFKIDINKLPKFINKSITFDNKIKNNQLTFNTLELYNKLFLLTVWDKKTKIQILVKLFGGCDRKNIVVMAENPKLIPLK